LAREVGEKLPNGYGLHDMSGNVDEIVWDGWSTYPSTAPIRTDYTGPNGLTYVYGAPVLRGGRAGSSTTGLTSRARAGGGEYGPSGGVRLVRTAPSP